MDCEAHFSSPKPPSFVTGTMPRVKLRSLEACVFFIWKNFKKHNSSLPVQYPFFSERNVVFKRLKFAAAEDLRSAVEAFLITFLCLPNNSLTRHSAQLKSRTGGFQDIGDAVNLHPWHELYTLLWLYKCFEKPAKFAI